MLQTVAWGTMLVDYAQSESLTVAVTKTFDGAHPCSLCHTVTEGREQEKQQEGAATIVKLDAVLAPTVQLPPRSEAPGVFFSVAPQPREVDSSPLTPPPRTV